MTGGGLSAPTEYIGYSGTGIFTQSGGTNGVGYGSLYLGYNAGNSGTYNLSGSGQVSAYYEYVGSSGTGTFTQSGAVNNTSYLYLGSNAGSSGDYNLSDSGQLSAAGEYIGPAGVATFVQSGGTNATSLLSIGSSGSYLLAGGELLVNGSLLNQGIFSGGGAAATLSANNILDISSGTWQNLGNISLSMGANSLLIVPAGFDPSTELAGFSTLGLTHTVGTTLAVPAGQGFSGSGTINDPVNCQGTITAAGGGAINLNGGLSLSGTGTINLGSGNLTTNDLLSGMNGGSLYVANQYVGNGGTGSFTQSGGNNSIGYYSGSLYLGNNAGDRGTYNLGGNGQLTAATEYVGYSGTGTFTQSGGANSIGSYYYSGPLYVGANAGGSGSYSLSGSGLLSANSEYVGSSGTGTFTQTGGTNNVNSYYAGSLTLGANAGGSGAYNLSGSGLLSANSEYLGYSGTGSFTQSGGTHTTNSLYLGYNAGSSGSYSLSGSGQLSATSEYVGYNSGATALFQQTGGSNASSFISIGSGGRYLLSGGMLDITGNGGISNQGVIDFTNSEGTLAIGNSCIVDLSQANLTNVTAMTVSMGTNSLLIVPAGFDPSANFAQYSNLGLTHTLGTTLNVPAGEGFGGSGSISDPVNCQGTIMAAGGGINLSGGLTLSGSGTVNLGSGNLTTNDLLSGMSGGALSVANQYVGNGGTGSFTQTGGNNNINSYYGSLYVGYNSGDAGTYNLSGSGQLSAPSESVGYSGTGTFTQSGGTNSTSYLYLGNNAGSSGTYNLRGSGLLSTYSEYVGSSGTGTFRQSGGTNSTSYLYLGNNAGSSGSYDLRGNGLLSAYSEYVGSSGTGTFRQSGGTNNINTYYSALYLGYNAGSSGAYNLRGSGLLSAVSEYIGYSGTGAFTQTGGTNNISNSSYGALYLGYNAGSSGTYILSGSGQLSATSEYVGYNPGATALFQQTGGSNASSFILIGSGGRYTLSGGTLNITGNGGISNQGIIDFTNSDATLAIGGSCIVDLSQANLTNVTAMTVSVGANSLLIVPAGFDTSTGFAQYSSLGLTHTVGTTLTVPAGQGFGGLGSIGDPVNCQGTITATAGTINLSGGLTLSGSGTVNLGSGNLTTNDLLSGMSGGSLYVAAHYVGNGGTGTFTQTGGNISIGNALYLGNNAGDSGTYNLSGTGQLSAPNEYLGYSGTGTFTQPGGTNSFNFGALYLGYNIGSSGTYSLSGSGQLSGPYSEYVGFSGTGTFTQSGGTHNTSNLYLGYNAGSSGMYNLSGNGQLSASYGESVGSSGTGTFTQSGGTHSVANSLYLGYNAGSSGTYNLGGSGQLSAASEYVGYNQGAIAQFQQSGGTNTVAVLSIGSGGTYVLAGGVLQVNGGLLNQGIFAGNGTPATLSNSNSILDLSSGTWQDLGALSVSMGANSLLIVPAGFNTSTDFAQYSSLGLTHTLGTTLTVPAGQGFVGSDSISDPVNCQGTITAVTGGAINLSGGLMLSGTGTVNLGSGTLTTNDLLSGISGGSLMVASQYVGSGGTGTFTQTGGINSIGSYYSGSLCLGNNAGDSGTYNLSGSGGVSAYVEYAGYSGTGSFTQTGGNNSTYYLYLGNNAGGSGSYSLSGGQLSASYEYVGYSGTGSFTQTGGTNSMSYGDFYLGNNAGGSGTYNLGGGQLSGPYFEYVGLFGTGSFTQSGGTNSTYYLYLGNNAGGSGIYSLSGSGQLSSTYGEYVGLSGTGNFTQTGGTNSISYGYLYLGNYAGGSGSYSLSGGQLSASYGEYVGYSGTGSFTQTGGTHAVASDLYLGYNAGSSGTYSLGGSGQLSAASEYVGYTAGLRPCSSRPAARTRSRTSRSAAAARICLRGGTLQVNGSLVNQGIFAGSIRRHRSASTAFRIYPAAPGRTWGTPR